MAAVMPEHMRLCDAPVDCGYIVGEALNQQWEWKIIALTLVISTCGAYTSHTITSHWRFCKNRTWYWIFTAAAGFAIGVNTVWCMHFVGMGALQLQGGATSGARGLIPMNFEVLLTVTSGFAAWFIAMIGLHIMADREVRKRGKVDREMFIRWGFASTLIATGVCVMHYMGMASQMGPFMMDYKAEVVFASCVIASVASYVGLLLLMIMRGSLMLRLAAAIVIAVAVNGMHYVGMLAATYTVAEETMSIGTGMAWSINTDFVAISSLVLDLILYTVCNFYGDQQRRSLEFLETKEDARRESELQNMVATAVASVDELGHPMVVVPAKCFLEMHAGDMLEIHERFREEGKLKVFDTMESVVAAKEAGALLVFFSYECLARQGGPNNTQLRVMKKATREVAAFVKRRSMESQLQDVYIWLDCLSIPQRNAAMKAAAIQSIYTYASVPDVMVLICPDSEHAITGLPANADTIKNRLWCRVEHLAYCVSRGTSSMLLHRGQGCEPLPDDWMQSVCCVHEANTTCCARLHEIGAKCDRENVVLPLLALYFDVYSRHWSGEETEEDVYAWKLIEQNRDRMFPRHYKYITKQGTEERPLFDDMLKRVERMVQDKRMGVLPPSRNKSSSVFFGCTSSESAEGGSLPFTDMASLMKLGDSECSEAPGADEVPYEPQETESHISF